VQLLLPFLLLLAVSPLAQAKDVDRAEYVRLAGEIRGLADRQAWSGVERAYQAALETEHPLSFRDHMSGAHAASASGDVAAVRERLFEAHQIEEDRKVVEWLWSIDNDYGKVSVVSKRGAELEAAKMPFDPARAKAVRYAAQTLCETGEYAGMLPAGAYQVGEVVFVVTAGVEAPLVSATGKRRRKRAG